jgi:hypothetical protein
VAVHGPARAERPSGPGEYIKQLTDDVKELNRRGTVAASPESFRMGWEDACRALADFPLYMADAFTVGRYPAEPRTMVSLQAKQLPSYAGSVPRPRRTTWSCTLNRILQVAVLSGDMRREREC